MKRRPTEFSSAMALCNGRIPLVPILCTAKGAGWNGKWHFNASVEWVKSVGGPWDTRDEAVAAALATGAFKLRSGTESNPHLDSI